MVKLGLLYCNDSLIPRLHDDANIKQNVRRPIEYTRARRVLL